MTDRLKPSSKKLDGRGPVLTIVMDGVGLTGPDDGNSWSLANTPVLDELMQGPHVSNIYAHGPYVGLPDDGDMGNSEVGHNALGAGKVYPQGAKLVNQSLESGDLYKGDTWQELMKNVQEKNSKLHFIGLLSDGNVHSHINHLEKMVEQANKEGVKTLRLHALLDGRDVEPESAHVYLGQMEDCFAKYSDCDYCIATVGGRMVISMDRYNANWSMVEKGWALQVEGKGRGFDSVLEGLETMRKETGKIDQDLEPYLITRDGKPVGTIDDGDSVIFFNFRGDRAIEISKAFDDKDLKEISREKYPDVVYAGMMEYDGDLHIPGKYLVNPPSIENTMGEYLIAEKVSLFACSETQKYGHVTYFWNGNKLGKFDEDLETYVEVRSDVIPFEQRPWMKAAEIADETIKLLESGKYQCGRINFANGDMVGHTGVIEASRIAMEAVDISLGRVLKVVKKLNGIAIILADHGNCEEMFEKKKGEFKKDKEGKRIVKTSHTLNKVPFIIYDPAYNGEYELNVGDKAGLANVAATTLNLMGYEAPADYDPSLVKLK